MGFFHKDQDIIIPLLFGILDGRIDTCEGKSRYDQDEFSIVVMVSIRKYLIE